MKDLYKVLRQLNINENEETFSKFRPYMERILAWNEKVNLTAITAEEEFIRKHFIDSILCADFDEVRNADRVIDVGTGAGFPGVPLALIYPKKKFLLIDSTGKKIKILFDIVNELKIRNVELIHTRAEDLAHKEEYRESFDLCVSRAVANLAELSEYCLPFVKRGGSFISYKGPDAEDEIEAAETAIKILGGDISAVKKIDMKGIDLNHKYIVIKKYESTPGKYPRKAGVASKKPIDVSRETFK